MGAEETITSYFDSSVIGTLTTHEDGLQIVVANMTMSLPASAKLLEITEHIHQGPAGTCVCGLQRRQRLSIRVKTSEATLMSGFEDPAGCSLTITRLWPADEREARC